MVNVQMIYPSLLRFPATEVQGGSPIFDVGPVLPSLEVPFKLSYAV